MTRSHFAVKDTLTIPSVVARNVSKRLYTSHVFAITPNWQQG